jgi:16S rRNA (uracil1498-N3)-methyltransferase
LNSPRFFVDDEAGELIAGREFVLPRSAAHHAANVLRMRAGDALTLFTGRGGEYAANLVAVDRRHVKVRVEAFIDIERESAIPVTLVQSLAANDPMDIALRKAVELGAAAIQPIVTERSARWPVGDRGTHRFARWRQLVVAACEQCGRNRVPDVQDAMLWPDWLAKRDPSRMGIVLSPTGLRSLALLPTPSNGIDLAVGAEGGFTDAEIDAASAAGVVVARLGPRIVRTETAGAAALAAIHALWGDFR